MISRRDFLSRSALTCLGLSSGIPPFAGLRGSAAAAQSDPDETVVTFLHTNDVHSRIDPFPPGPGRNADRAGAARRATLIDRITAECAANGRPRPLLLDAGDVFQGTPYFNLFKGELDIRVMSKLGYDVMTIGNHDFDGGVDALVNALDLADFPVVSANYDVSGTPLAGRVVPHIIREMGPVRVGIFGLGVILGGLVPAPLCAGVAYSDPIAAARREASHLRFEKKCDLVVALSHLGIDGNRGEPGDREIAGRIAEIDLVIGGHSHTFMREPERFPHGERETLVFQVGFAGLYLGRVDFTMRSGEPVRASASAFPVGPEREARAART